jgi:hypothetical protein
LISRSCEVPRIFFRAQVIMNGESVFRVKERGGRRNVVLLVVQRKPAPSLGYARGWEPYVQS